ncbi:MAG: exodeoxyribonuclease VII small subunit [Clostridia bacterium]|nr:exodeoxyribonuclease VII small subunit [Clostridia bacterium]
MEDMTYEKAMARLEVIVKSLEQSTLSLDESLKLYEEGTKLANYCNTVLDNAEAKITTLANGDEA